MGLEEEAEDFFLNTVGRHVDGPEQAGRNLVATRTLESRLDGRDVGGVLHISEVGGGAWGA